MVQVQIDAALAERVHRLNEMPRGSPELEDGPYHHDLELVTGGKLKQRLQYWSFPPELLASLRKPVHLPVAC